MTWNNDNYLHGLDYT